MTRWIPPVMTLVLLSGASLPAQSEGEAGPCFLTTGTSAFGACFSPTGNLTRFTVRGVDFLNVGYAREGWGLCTDHEAVSNAYDYDAGGYDDQPIGPVTSTWFVQPTPGKFPLTVYTQLSDLKLTQYLSVDTAKRTVTIKHTVKNTGRRTLPRVGLSRVMDIDANGTPDDDVVVRSADAVTIITDRGAGSGVTLAIDNRGVPHSTGFATPGTLDPSLEAVCSSARDGDAGLLGTVPSDYIAAVVYELGTLRPGAYKTVSVTYRAF